MRLLASVGRVGRNRQIQLERTLANANECATKRKDTLERAQEHRDSIDQIDANPMVESDLSRSELFARLRTMAIGQAHATELKLYVSSLEASAADLTLDEKRLRQQAIAHQRKVHKLTIWARKRSADDRRRTERKDELESQENQACRLISTYAP
jgi:hypothetical protein